MIIIIMFEYYYFYSLSNYLNYLFHYRFIFQVYIINHYKYFNYLIIIFFILMLLLEVNKEEV